MALPALSVPSFEQAKVAFASVKDLLAPVASDPSSLRERLGAALLVIARYTAELERLARSQHKRIAALELALSPRTTAEPLETEIGRALSADDAARRACDSRTVDCTGTPPAPSMISHNTGYETRSAASPQEQPRPSRSAQSSVDRPHPLATGTTVVMSRRFSAGHHVTGGTPPESHASVSAIAAAAAAAAAASVASAQQHQQQPQRQSRVSLRGKAAWTVIMPAAGVSSTPPLPAAPLPAPTSPPLPSLPQPPLARPSDETAIDTPVARPSNETARDTSTSAPTAGGVGGGLGYDARGDAPPLGASMSMSHPPPPPPSARPLPPLGNLPPTLLQSTDQWHSSAGATQQQQQRGGSPHSPHSPAPSETRDPSQDAEREEQAQLGASVARPATPPLPPPASLLPAQLRTWSPAAASPASAAGGLPPPPAILQAAESADATSADPVLPPPPRQQPQAATSHHATDHATVASPAPVAGGRGWAGASSNASGGDGASVPVPVGGASAGGRAGHHSAARGVAQLPVPPPRAAPHARLQLARNAVLGGAW